MKKIIIPLVIVAALILGGVLVFMRSGGESQAAKLAPGESVFFVNIPNIPRTGFRWTGTALARIAAEPEVRAFMDMPLRQLNDAPGTDEATNILVALKPGNIFMAATSESQGSTEGLLGFQFWGNRKDYDNAVARLRRELPDAEQEPVKESHHGLEIIATRHGDRTLYTAAAGRWGFLSSEAQLIRDALDRATNRPTSPALSANPRFGKVISQLPLDPDLLVFIQPDKALDSLLAAGQSLGAQAIPSQVEHLRATEALGGALKLDGLLQRDAIFVLRPGDPESAPKLMHRAMELTTGNTTLFLDFALNFAALPAWVESLSDVYPGVAEPALAFSQTIAEVYGPECALMGDWRDGSMVPSPLFAVLVKDAARATDLFRQTMGMVPGASLQEIEGTPVFTFPAQFTTLAVAQSDAFLVAGMDPEAVARAASRKDAVPTLASAPVFKPALTDFKQANEAFCFIDTGTVFERLYGSLIPVLRFSAAMMPDINRRMDVSKIPQASTISRHLPPITLSQRRTSDGTLVESSGPISMTQFLLIGGAVAASANQSLFGR